MFLFVNKLFLNYSIFSCWDWCCRINIGCFGDIYCKIKMVKYEVNYLERERKKRKKFFFNKYIFYYLFIMFYY